MRKHEYEAVAFMVTCVSLLELQENLGTNVAQNSIQREHGRCNAELMSLKQDSIARTWIAGGYR